MTGQTVLRVVVEASLQTSSTLLNYDLSLNCVLITREPHPYLGFCTFERYFIAWIRKHICNVASFKAAGVCRSGK